MRDGEERDVFKGRQGQRRKTSVLHLFLFHTALLRHTGPALFVAPL